MDRFAEMAAFVRVVRSGSITAAAAQQSIAKSAVSKRLMDLEKRIGVQLLTRTTRRLTLTSAGSEFLERAEAILADVEEAESEALSAHGRLSGRVRVAAPLTFGLMHLSPVIRSFSLANPEVKLDLDLARRDCCSGCCKSGRILCVQTCTGGGQVSDPETESRQQGDQDDLEQRPDSG